MVSKFNFDDENSYKIIDLIDAGIYWKDKKGRILGCNNYVLRMAGVDNKAKIIGKTDFDLWHKADAEKLTATDTLAISTETYKSEESITLPNGTSNAYLSTKSTLLNEKGNPIGIVVVLVDITDQKNIFEREKQQIISNEQMKFMQILDVVNASIYWKDKEGHILGCNKYMLDMFGADSRAQIIGKTDYDVYPPKIAQMISKTDKLVMQNGAHESEEYAILNGKERIFLSAKNRLLDKDGNIAGLVGASIDITDKKEAEQLKIEKDKHRAITAQQEHFNEFIRQLIQTLNPLVQLIDNFKFSDLNNKLGKPQENISNLKSIKLTKREKEILYYLALNQTPKQIASIFSNLEDKNVSPATIQAIINKGLYIKFNVANLGQLIEKANLAGFIPFILNDESLL